MTIISLRFTIFSFGTGEKTSTKRTMDSEAVRATVVTAGHCTHAELTSGHALASCYSCCVHSLLGLCELTS